MPYLTSLVPIEIQKISKEDRSPFMPFNRVFPYALAICFVVGVFAATAAAQTEPLRPRRVTVTTEVNSISRLENDVIILHEETNQPNPILPSLVTPRIQRFDQILLAAIDTRLGAPYVYGATGPHVFDCSGFVWSVFQSAGIHFDRSSARTFWSRFEAAGPDEEFKFGTLVFFNNLKHVGIVADQNGFYHASPTRGVIYSPFKGYWQNRIDGFRRVPLPALTVAD